ncbi:MAG: pantetheine-phosphate adenylyltransferase [Bacilli bacterium]|jgi:pantetheine-phosphate adenylyltransferase|nr:pantetheine-phosphate adenylyltransferase [Bacilli bacterium]
MIKKAIYPGSFDPVSNGHIDIIERIARLFETIFVVVAVNPNKHYVFTADERVEMLKKATAHIKNVVIEKSDLILVDYVRQKEEGVIIRGVRNVNDYQNEITMFQFNHTSDPNIETLVMFPSSHNLFISASYIKELALFNADISPYVPEGLAEFISQKIRERK